MQKASSRAKLARKDVCCRPLDYYAGMAICLVLLVVGQILLLIRTTFLHHHPFWDSVPTRCSWLSTTIRFQLNISSLVLAAVTTLLLIPLYLTFQQDSLPAPQQRKRRLLLESQGRMCSLETRELLQRYGLVLVTWLVVAVLLLQMFIMAPPDKLMTIGGLICSALCFTTLILISLYRLQMHLQREQDQAATAAAVATIGDVSSGAAAAAADTDLARFFAYRHVWTWPVYLTLIVTTIFGLACLFITFGQIEPLFTEHQVAQMEALSPNLTMPDVGNRVVLIVLDGMRLDETQTNENWVALMNDPQWNGDLVALEGQAELPTVSLPNWVTIWSGSEPSITGVLGNLLIPEIIYDSLVGQCAKKDHLLNLDGLDPALSYGNNKNATTTADLMQQPTTFRRGVCGSRWFSSIVESKLVPLQSICDVPILSHSRYINTHPDSISLNGLFELFSGSTSLTLPLQGLMNGKEAEKILNDAEQTDTIRTRITTQALAQTGDDTYRLFLLHLESTDHVAHLYGAKSPQYHRAAALQALAVRQVLDVVQAHPDANKTLVIITSDHGHVDEGGHGGSQPILKRIPLLFYYANASLASTPYINRHPKVSPAGEVQPKHSPWSLVDLPTMAAMVLGVRVPRQSTGIYVEPWLPLLAKSLSARIVQFMDLYEQKRQLMWFFLVQTGAPIDVLEDLAHRFKALMGLAQFETQVPSVPGFTMVELLSAAIYELQDIGEHARQEILTISFLRNILFAMGAVLCLFTVIGARFVAFHRRVSDDGKVVWYSLATVLLYLVVVLVIYPSAYAGLGYPIWDSTQLHSNVVVARYSLLTLLPGTIFMWLQLRVLCAWYRQIPPGKPTETPGTEVVCGLWQVLWADYYVWSGYVSHQSYLLLFFSYQLLWTTAAVCLVVMLESAVCFFFPMNVSLFVQADFVWMYRFQVLTVHMMLVPLIVFLLWYNLVFSRSLTVKLANGTKQP